MHLVCFGYGMYGYRKEECPHEASGRATVPENKENEDSNKETGLEGNGMIGGRDGVVNLKS